ncbi:DnaJ domain-containing protein [uncultured Alsobacter sp.]|uniref:DnaJ domain-containing protein n=1 Tax=uncultured Alsobacter sp. TaxID=1748258 RepID=UPI0025F67921|nr:DnaJ domain-containing protein [uncultured Alsobacter sp.]
MAVGLIWWLLKSYAKANPAFLAKNVRKAGGALALVAAAFLVFRGRIDIAIPLGGFGAWLLDLPGFSMPGWGQRTTSAPGGTSKVRSRLIEMELDHGTGALRGRVTDGAMAGRELDALGEAELADLEGLCRASDPEGARLLEAYLDRRFPGRRKAAQGDADTGPPGRDRNAMSEKEAYEILGLPLGAGEDDIRSAHRALMKKLHPDQGGSTYLATRVNQAKDVLLSRHR